MTETLRAKALRLIGDRKVRLDRERTEHPRRYVFLVVGDSADPLHPEPYTVVREPGHESCTCPAVKTCSHIEAARIFAEMSGHPKGVTT